MSYKKYLKCGSKFLKIAQRLLTWTPQWHTVTNADFSTDYGTRLAGLTSAQPLIKIPSHVKAGTVTNQLWDCSNASTEYITFTDETDFALNRFDVASGPLREITNIPNTVNSMVVTTPNVKVISSVANLTSFTLNNNTKMADLSGVDGLSGNTNITSLNLKNNTGLTDLSGFVIPPNVGTLNALFQGCSALAKARIDSNFTSAIWSSSNLMFQRTVLKRLDIHANDVQSLKMFSGYGFGSGAVEIRCTPNTNTWNFWKNYMVANSTPFRQTYDGAVRFCLHSFDVSPKSIAVWGDSLTRGGDGTTYSDLCARLAGMLSSDTAVQNLGAGGTSAVTQATYFNHYDVGWNDITVLFFGHNSPDTTIAAYNETYIPKLSKYIVLGLVTKNYSTTMNNQMATEYGEHFVDTHAYMVEHGFEITGLTPTEQDETDLANGNVPHSFLASDYIHINEYGGLIVATALKEKLLALGYIDSTWLADS